MQVGCYELHHYTLAINCIYKNLLTMEIIELLASKECYDEMT